ncbi:hypothetical protein EGW08_014820 [Elysia chlorotica]|uniref:Uncharacterized protein n=1 Tax=Elysia chlorotica TaxID=188477 RepID=A0A433T758_ELYCH|nr:hypothetical protein EGW08_014820 [Elysia chlorotica]
MLVCLVRAWKPVKFLSDLTQITKMLPNMQGTGYRQIYTVLYVTILCCCVSLNVQARAVGSLEGSVVAASPSRRVQRSITDLQNILASLEQNRKSYEESMLALDGPRFMNDRESDLDLALPSQAKSSTDVLSRGYPAQVVERRTPRRCYWNVVSCY